MGFTMPEPLENGESTVVQLLLKGNITHAVPTTEFQLTIDWP